MLAYLCFNRGVQLIGANRAAPFLHLAGVRLGDGDPAARRTAAAVSTGRLSAGARGRGDRLATGLCQAIERFRAKAFSARPIGAAILDECELAHTR